MAAVLWNAPMVSSTVAVVLWDAVTDFIMLWNASTVFSGVTTVWRDPTTTFVAVMLRNAVTGFRGVTIVLWDARIVFPAVTMILWNAMRVFSVDRPTVSGDRHAANVLYTTTCPGGLRVLRL